MPTPPPFDPEIARALRENADVVTTLAASEIASLRTRSTRPTHDAMTRNGAFVLSTHRIGVPRSADAPDHPEEPGFSDAAASGPDLVLLRPRRARERTPVLLWIHGGGLVVGTPYDDLPSVSALAAATGFAVASVDYRLAPEHPYPAAIDDVYAALEWLAEHARELGLDPDRIVVAGVSAGGGLAAAAALLARDRGGPALLGQMLLCPMLDDRNDSDSSRQMAGIGAWDRSANATAWAAYLDRAAADPPSYAAPARAGDLAGLPPAFIDVGSAETFRDEDVEYARRIWAAGGAAELHVWPGGAHGFTDLAPNAALSRDAAAARVWWLTRILAQSRVDAAVVSAST